MSSKILAKPVPRVQLALKSRAATYRTDTAAASALVSPSMERDAESTTGALEGEDGVASGCFPRRASAPSVSAEIWMPQLGAVLSASLGVSGTR